MDFYKNWVLLNRPHEENFDWTSARTINLKSEAKKLVPLSFFLSFFVMTECKYFILFLSCILSFSSTYFSFCWVVYLGTYVPKSISFFPVSRWGPSCIILTTWLSVSLSLSCSYFCSLPKPALTISFRPFSCNRPKLCVNVFVFYGFHFCGAADWSALDLIPTFHLKSLSKVIGEKKSRNWF